MIFFDIIIISTRSTDIRVHRAGSQLKNSHDIKQTLDWWIFSASDPLCQAWSKEHGFIDKYLSKHRLDEIVILEKDNGDLKKSTVCYKSKAGK